MEDTLTLDGLPARGADEQEEREAEQLLRANPTPPVLVNVRHPPPRTPCHVEPLLPPQLRRISDRRLSRARGLAWVALIASIAGGGRCSGPRRPELN